MDEADRADGAIEHLIADGMERVRRKLARCLPSIGVCHNCESEVGSGRIFCSKDCSDDWDARQAARRRNGE